jgi:hypothetical protein
MELAAMWNLALADVLADQCPCHRSNQSYLNLETLYHHCGSCLFALSMVKLDAKEIEISKKKKKIRNLAPHLTLRLRYFRMHRLCAKMVLHR